MHSLKKIGTVVRFNFLGFYRNPRIILTFLLAVVLCFLLSERVLRVAQHLDTSMQAAEPFIWTFGDGTNILLASLLLILMFSDVPKAGPATPYYLSRMKRIQWMAAQFLYIGLGTVFYAAFIMLVTIILCQKYTFPGNLWSETAVRLAYSDLGNSMGIPASVKAMESITPYECMLQTLVLMLLYSWTLCFLMLTVNLKFGRTQGIFAGVFYSLYGFLLEPDTIVRIFDLGKQERYRVNVLTGWISPLNHASYPGHSFGYDKLPTIFQSAVLFLVLLAALSIFSCRALKRYNFTFMGY